MKLRQLLSKINKDYFYLMHLSYGYGREQKSRKPLWEYASRKNIIGIDWDPPNVNAKWQYYPERLKKRLTWVWRDHFEYLCNKMRPNDCVIAVEGQTHLLGVGLVQAPYTYRSKLRNTFFRHVRPIHWLLKYKFEDRIGFELPGFDRTILYVDKLSSYWRIINHELGSLRPIQRQVITQAEETRALMTHLKKKHYGPYGEGTAHRELKYWIAKNPHSVGVARVLKRTIEYPFLSGDLADIVFDLDDNRYAIVEIETDNPEPGAHQAVKYKVLKCLEEGWEIHSDRVEAILVAWEMPRALRSFCRKYRVRCVEKKL